MLIVGKVGAAVLALMLLSATAVMAQWDNLGISKTTPGDKFDTAWVYDGKSIYSNIAIPKGAPAPYAAMAAGDTAAIEALVALYKGYPGNERVKADMANIAQMLLAFAQANKTSDPTKAALMAAIAVNSGGLSSADQIAALGIVNTNPAALALLLNANAPKTGGSLLTSGLDALLVAGTAIIPSQSGRRNGSPN